MSAVFNITDVARLLKISRSQAIRELPSWPHQGEGLLAIFTVDDVVEIKRLLNAGPEEQAARQQFLEQEREEVRALDDQREVDQSIKDYSYDHESLADDPNH